MPLDPSIVTSTRPVQLPDAENLIRLSQLSTQGKAQQFALGQAQRQAKQQATLSDLYRQNLKPDGTLDNAAVTQGMAAAGYGDAIPALQQQGREAQAAEVKNQGAQLSLHKQKLDVVNNTMASLLADPQLTHDKVISSISSLVDQGVIDANQGAQMVRTLPGPDQLRPFLVSKAVETMDASQKIAALIPKYDEQDRGGVINQGSINQLTGERTAGADIPKTSTPGEQLIDKRVRANSGGDLFTPEEGSLMAALAERGISLPAGLRSKAQMKSTFASLISRNPGMSPDDIAEKIATGQIGINAERKETSTAAAQAGKVAVAVQELSTFGDQVLNASNAVPRGRFLPVNKLIQMTDAQLSDPALINLKTKMQALNNAYDQLAARGGTDAEKRAHIAQLFSTATSPEGVAALVQAVKDEGKAAEEAARKATQRRPKETSQASGPGTGSGDVPDDIAALLLKHGGE